ncbi:MAG TPA: hypothetical protein PLD88_09115, partial [Candidatus Berkiella sp.]|nr:hypothetical protein [Candidatus Berkiella sp.]
MKTLNYTQLNLIAGGLCEESYEAVVPLDYLAIVAAHLKLLNKHQFDHNAMLQALRDAGLDTSVVN